MKFIPVKGVKLKKNELVILGISAVLIFGFLVYKLVFSVIFIKLQDLQIKIKAEESRLARGIEIEGRKDQINSDYQRYLPYLKSGDFGEEAMTRFLKEIEKIIYDSGGSVIAISPQSQRSDSEQEKDYVRYYADLQIEVTLSQLFSFLDKIDQSKMLIRVDSFSLSPKNEQANIFKIDSTVSVVLLK
jgi:hypothetical protein